MISLATDLGVLRSFKEGQQFWTFGHTIHGIYHIARKDALYVWLSYYADGDFENNLTGIARSPSTVPPQIAYTNKSELEFRQFSLGYRRFLKGDYEDQSSYNIYGYVGLGILFPKVTNSQSPVVDTSLYAIPVQDGEGAFKRLTLDLGLGFELPLGNTLFLYAEGRTWLPTTDYPSKYLYVNNEAPICGMINIGLRILFD